jgi:predicted ABC-type ATPase
VISRPPTLFIIAGPNGAGKSTNSATILHPFNLKAFDYDIELEQAWSRFGFDPAVEDGVRESVGELFLQMKNAAIQNNTDFAFETNYYHDSIVQSVNRFKEAGHETVIIFLALPNEESAIARVKRRVTLGGHSVDENTIRERYKKGLQLLDRTFDAYDRVHLYLSEENEVKLILTLDPKNKIVQSETTQLMDKLPRLNTFVRSIEKE